MVLGAGGRSRGCLPRHVAAGLNLLVRRQEELKQQETQHEQLIAAAAELNDEPKQAGSEGIDSDDLAQAWG